MKRGYLIIFLLTIVISFNIMLIGCETKDKVDGKELNIGNLSIGDRELVDSNEFGEFYSDETLTMVYKVPDEKSEYLYINEKVFWSLFNNGRIAAFHDSDTVMHYYLLRE